MKMSKSWKSELKKKGAMALTAFMLCGSAGTAFADSMNILDSGTGDTDNQGNVKTVTGYQTDKAVGYAANITWGNMLFVYDRGTYDPSTGKLIGSFRDGALGPRTDIEINGDREQAGFWYGFDGTNNAVQIENFSTETVKLTATPEVTGTNAGGVEFSLYVSSENKTWDAASDVDSTNGGVKHNLNASDSDKSTWKIGTSDGAISRVFDARTFNNDGSENTTDSDVIYLNITGRPADEFMDETTYNDNAQAGEKLGTITLSFSTTSDPAEELAPLDGDKTSP